MQIAAGTRLGPYEVVAAVGAGGMGEVYRGTDTRLDRVVALKILPSHLSSNSLLRERFDREARAISALTHPHIATLYDIGHHDGTDYLVMEFVDGESLEERLKRGPLPIEQVLQYGIDIAEALDNAHRHGIVHRDLKPSNIMITKSGAKLLDFGLAKMAMQEPVVQLSHLPTAQRQLTQEGTILGTFQYMAPEQLEGLEADARTDIFAFGAVLYEMATGRRAFEGKTKTSLIAAIVDRDPPAISSIYPLTAPAFERVVKTCLGKDPENRWQSARDVANELRWIQESGGGVAAPVAERRKSREWMWWSTAPLLVATGAALGWGMIQLRKPAPQMVESTILPPDKAQFAFNDSGAPAISPDGTRIVFSATSGGVEMLYVRKLSSSATQPLAGTEGGASPFWSPDGKTIGFFAPGKLKKIDANGGPAQVIADAPAGRGGSWSEAGTILFAPSLNGPLMAVSDSGGAAKAVTHLDISSRETTHRWPCFLPDGRHFLYVAGMTGSPFARIIVSSLDDDTHRELLRASSQAVYSPTGYLLFLREHSLMAQPFDAKHLTLGRDALPIADNIATSNRLDGALTASATGTLVYETGAAGAVSQLTWVDLAGKPAGTLGKQADIRNLAISHDGKRVAVQVNDPALNASDIWIDDIARGTSTRLTFDPANEYAPKWSPDDHTILYTSNAKSAGDLMVKPSSGTGGEEVLYANADFKIGYDWSPDGKTIAFQDLAPSRQSNFDIWLFSIADRKAWPAVRTPFADVMPSFSPDGRWLMYQSNESGKNQIYVIPLDATGKWQISIDGGSRAIWRRDGKQIFYMSDDSKLMAVDVAISGNEFLASVPRVLFPMNVKVPNPFPQYDVTPDGKRFLVNMPLEQAQVAPLTLVQNWTAALEK